MSRRSTIMREIRAGDNVADLTSTGIVGAADSSVVDVTGITDVVDIIVVTVFDVIAATAVVAVLDVTVEVLSGVVF